MSNFSISSIDLSNYDKLEQSTGASQSTILRQTQMRYFHYYVIEELHMLSLVKKLEHLGPDIFKDMLSFLNVFDLIKLEMLLETMPTLKQEEAMRNRQLNTAKKMVKLRFVNKPF